MTAPTSETVRLVLDGNLTIRTVEAIHSRLLEAVRGGANLKIDCAAASNVDVSFIQLLLAARSSARELGREITLAAPAAGALLDTLKRGGFLAADDLLADDDAFWRKGAPAT
jgi:anti-anti-sigma regulatory factor